MAMSEAGINYLPSYIEQLVSKDHWFGAPSVSIQPGTDAAGASL